MPSVSGQLTAGTTRPDTTAEAFKLTDDILAEPGRVDAVVRCGPTVMAGARLVAHPGDHRAHEQQGEEGDCHRAPRCEGDDECLLL